MNSAIRASKIDIKALEKEKEIVDKGLTQKESNPYFLLRETMIHHLWGNLYTYKNPTGNHVTILSALLAKLIKP